MMRHAVQRYVYGYPGLHGWVGRVARLEPILVMAVLPFLWFPRPASNLLLLLLPALWVVRWLARGHVSVRTYYDVPTLALLLVLPATLLPVVDWSLAAPKLYALIGGLALTYALANALRTARQVQYALYGTVVVLGGMVALVALVGTEWPPQRSLPLDALYNRLPMMVQGVVRGTQWGGIHSNEIGGALTLLLPLAVALSWTALTDQRARARWLLRSATIGAATGMTLVLLLSQSRSAYVGCMTGMAILVAWWLLAVRRSKHSQWVVSTAAIGMGIAGVVIAARLTASWTGGSSLDSLPTRLELWSRAFLMLQDFPFTGIGIGQFPEVVRTLYVPLLLPPGVYTPHAHNFVLQLGLDLGIPGAVAVLFILGGCFRSAWEAYRLVQDRELQAGAIGLAAGLAGFLVYGLTDTIAIGARGGLGLWMVLGLAAALAGLARMDRDALGSQTD